MLHIESGKGSQNAITQHTGKVCLNITSMHNFDLLRSKSAFYQSEAAFLRRQIAIINIMSVKWPHYKPAFSDIKKQYVKDVKSYLLESFRLRMNF